MGITIWKKNEIELLRGTTYAKVLLHEDEAINEVRGEEADDYLAHSHQWQEPRARALLIIIIKKKKH